MADSLKELLEERISSRSIQSSRTSGLIFLSSLLLAITMIWTAVSMDKHVQTVALYILMSLLVFVSVCVFGYFCMNIRKNRTGVTDTVGSRSWHKVGYKVLVGVAVLEHCVFFISIAVMVYHSLGLSLTQCFSKHTCIGFHYEGWVTTSVRFDSRVQTLQSQPVVVELSSTQRSLFWTYMSALVVGLVTVGIFFFVESRRRAPPAKENRIAWIRLHRWRLSFVRVMGLVCVIPLVLSLLGIFLVGSNWFSVPLVFSIVSLYPVFLIKRSPSREHTITRFQFRSIAQISISLVFLWLYGYGSGSAISLISAVSMRSQDEKLIMDSASVAQLILLLVSHFIFAVSCAGGIYLHVSVSDIAESIIRTRTAKSEYIPATTLDVQAPDTLSVVSWGCKLCASCSTHAPNSVLVPCGHSVICTECSSVLLTIPGFRCPLCCVEVFDCQRSDATPRYTA